MRGNRSSWEITLDDEGTVMLAFKPHQSQGWRGTTKYHMKIVEKFPKEGRKTIASTVMFSFRGGALSCKTF